MVTRYYSNIKALKIPDFVEMRKKPKNRKKSKKPKKPKNQLN